MRDFRDAKAMAQTLRQSLTGKSVSISHSESLELVSKMLGAADWNTLSAAIQAGRREGAAAPADRPQRPGCYPAIPMRDLVPFPNAAYPIFAGRQKTMRAIDLAFDSSERETVIAVQKDSAMDEPTMDHLHEIGVLARLIQVVQLGDGTMKALIEVQRRVMIRRFFSDGDGYMAEIEEISEGPVQEAPDPIRQSILIQHTIAHFREYADAREVKVPRSWPSLESMRDPGQVADIICTYLLASLEVRQELLATLDPVERLQKVDALLAAG
jgi:ATP-dependent Lon protease